MTIHHPAANHALQFPKETPAMNIETLTNELITALVTNSDTSAIVTAIGTALNLNTDQPNTVETQAA